MKKSAMTFTSILLFMTLFSETSFGISSGTISKELENVDGCFLMMEIGADKPSVEHNEKRCDERLPPMSTFKIVLSAMAFDTGYFKSLEQPIKWDGKDRGRKSINRDQTPISFIKNSAIWVSRLIVNHLGRAQTQGYVDRFKYGNRSVSGDLGSFWLTKGSLRISAREQIQFLKDLWRNELRLDENAHRLTLASLYGGLLENGARFYGKTGSGCIDPGCELNPGRQLGWYVGVMSKNGRDYAFALNFSEREPARGYAGPRARNMVTRILADFETEERFSRK